MIASPIRNWFIILLSYSEQNKNCLTGGGRPCRLPYIRQSQCIDYGLLFVYTKDKLKSVFNSGKAMSVVNLLFLLSLLIPNRGIIFIACTAWIGYLVYSIRNTSSIVVKAANGVFIALAVLMIAVNLYFLLEYHGAG